MYERELADLIFKSKPVAPTAMIEKYIPIWYLFLFFVRLK